MTRSVAGDSIRLRLRARMQKAPRETENYSSGELLRMPRKQAFADPVVRRNAYCSFADFVLGKANTYTAWPTRGRLRSKANMLLGLTSGLPPL